jgi:chromosome segregation ATPase
VIIAGLWGYFTYTTSDKNWQIESKQKDIESLQKDKKQLEDDTAYWQRQIEQYKSAAVGSAKNEADMNVKYQSLNATEQAEHKELDADRGQIKSLATAVGKQADAAGK